VRASAKISYVWPPDYLFTDIVPFLWPFVLLSVGVALTPVSPISWSYSTWLLFIIPLIITIFAPIRTFSGPLRFAYVEYASKIASLAVSLLKAVIVNFQAIPTLALPAFFLLPMLPILFFVFFPALPVIWHFIAYRYRLRLKAVVTSVTETNASLDLVIARASQALSNAHIYEKQAVATTQVIPKVTLSRHSTDFSTPVFEGHWRLTQIPGTLGADLARKVLDTEKQMAVIEDASQGVRALSERAVAVATEGDMVVGEELAGSAAQSMESIVKQVDGLLSTADQARSSWIEFRHSLSQVTTFTSKTINDLDLAVTQARRAATLAHSYEFVSQTQLSAQSSGTLGAELARKVLDTERQMAAIEDASQGVRALSGRAIAAASEGNTVVGEQLAKSIAQSMEEVVKQVNELLSTADQARRSWVEFRSRLNEVTASASKTTIGLDLAVTQARRAAALAQTYDSKTRLSAQSTLGGKLAGKVLDTENQLAVIEDASKGVRALSERAVAVATEGDMAVGEELAKSTAESMEKVVKQVNELVSTTDEARSLWVEFHRRSTKVTTSTSTITAGLDLAVTQARRAVTLAHTYEKQALAFVSETRRSASHTLALHGAEVQQARQTISVDSQRVCTLGNSLAEKVQPVAAKLGDVELEAKNIRALLEQAVTATVDGDVGTGETLTVEATEALKSVVETVQGMASTSDDVRQDWVKLSVEDWVMP